MLRFYVLTLRGGVISALCLAGSTVGAQEDPPPEPLEPQPSEPQPSEPQPSEPQVPTGEGEEVDEGGDQVPSAEVEANPSPKKLDAEASPVDSDDNRQETETETGAAPEAPNETTKPSAPAASDATEPKSEQERKLVPRLKEEQKPTPPPREPAFPAPVAQLERDQYRARQVPTRQEEMPGDYVARPITAPRGTFIMTFAQGLIFAQSDPFSALAPAFAWGITEQVEIGVDGPLRFDAGLKEWAALDPQPHIAVTVFDEEMTEVGLRARGLIPATTDVDPAVSAAVPIRIHTRNDGRIDIGPEFELGLGEVTRMKVFLPIEGALQFSDGVYGAVMARPHFGLTTGTKTGVDGQLTLGLTHQSRERAFVDLALDLFMKNIATGETEFSDGAGGMLSLTFFPEFY